MPVIEGFGGREGRPTTRVRSEDRLGQYIVERWDDEDGWQEAEVFDVTLYDNARLEARDYAKKLAHERPGPGIGRS